MLSDLYVFLSFLFEIVVEFMFLICVLDSICSSTMLVHMISLISVIAGMIYFVLIRTKSRSNLLIYSTGGPYNHSRFMDGLVDASKEPFVHCYECPMLFCGSPADMVHHLTDACSGHCWPLVENINYDTCYRFTMPKSLDDHRRLLVSE